MHNSISILFDWLDLCGLVYRPDLVARLHYYCSFILEQFSCYNVPDVEVQINIEIRNRYRFEVVVLLNQEFAIRSELLLFEGL